MPKTHILESIGKCARVIQAKIVDPTRAKILKLNVHKKELLVVCQVHFLQRTVADVPGRLA